MSNSVYNKLVFNPLTIMQIFTHCYKDGNFDFNTLVPQPIQLYHGDLLNKNKDEEDFKCNWYDWRKENWGTKSNALDTRIVITEKLAIIEFITANNIPYPIISAVANKFNIPFEHQYYEECENFWGIEKWDKENKVIQRISKHQNLPEDKKDLLNAYNKFLKEVNEEKK